MQQINATPNAAIRGWIVARRSIFAAVAAGSCVHVALGAMAPARKRASIGRIKIVTKTATQTLAHYRSVKTPTGWWPVRRCGRSVDRGGTAPGGGDRGCTFHGLPANGFGRSDVHGANCPVPAWAG